MIINKQLIDSGRRRKQAPQIEIEQ